MFDIDLQREISGVMKLRMVVYAVERVKVKLVIRVKRKRARINSVIRIYNWSKINKKLK